MTDTVHYDNSGPLATITMDDGKVNALSLAMQQQLHAALDRAEADGAVVVLAGRPGVFSAGFDLAVLQEGSPDAAQMVTGGFELALRLLAFPRPVVVACTGHAVAAGAFLLLSGDLRIGAAGPYRLVANEVAIGLTVPHAAIEVLRQRLTPAAFNRSALLSEVFAPEDGLGAGFLDRVVAPDEVLVTATEAALQLAVLDAEAHTATKLRARAGAVQAVRDGLEQDRDEFALALA